MVKIARKPRAQVRGSKARIVPNELTRLRVECVYLACLKYVPIPCRRVMQECLLAAREVHLAYIYKTHYFRSLPFDRRLTVLNFQLSVICAVVF